MGFVWAGESISANFFNILSHPDVILKLSRPKLKPTGTEIMERGLNWIQSILQLIFSF